MTSTPLFPTFGLKRRHLLGGALAAGALQLVPGSWAVAAASVAGSESFMALSRYLTERDDLRPAMAASLLKALQSVNDKSAAEIDTLWKWIDSNHIALADLNTRLKAEQPELAKLPASVMQLWYQGIAGSGTNTRVVAYEYALNAQLVSDKLRPPSYCYGTYGSWSLNPNTFELQLQMQPAQA